ncbi:9921_t:CDS:2, partial [Acaulospora colombiana]
FDTDETIQKYVQKGQVIVVKGDALNKEQIQAAWQAANQDNRVDLVLFSVGGTPTFHLLKGFEIQPPNITTHALSNLLQTIAADHGHHQMPKLVAITTTGATKASHDALPFSFKIFYSYALNQPHVDKLGMERLLQYAAGMEWKEGVEPAEEILPKGWEQHYPPAGWLPQIVIVRPALLTDGEAKQKYKASTDEFASYTISRKDTGHFIGQRVVSEWETWSGKIVNVGN